MGERKQDLLLDLKKAVVTRPTDRRWDNSSDHTPILYKVKDINIKPGGCRISKSMLKNRNNIKEAGKHYRQYMPVLIERVRLTSAGSVEDIFKEVARSITEPWTDMAQMRPKNRSPHFNLRLDKECGVMRARKRAIKSNIDVYWEDFEEKRSSFEGENRRRPRSFPRRT